MLAVLGVDGTLVTYDSTKERAGAELGRLANVLAMCKGRTEGTVLAVCKHSALEPLDDLEVLTLDCECACSLTGVLSWVHNVDANLEHGGRKLALDMWTSPGQMWLISEDTVLIAVAGWLHTASLPSLEPEPEQAGAAQVTMELQSLVPECATGHPCPETRGQTTDVLALVAAPGHANTWYLLHDVVPTVRSRSPLAVHLD